MSLNWGLSTETGLFLLLKSVIESDYRLTQATWVHNLWSITISAIFQTKIHFIRPPTPEESICEKRFTIWNYCEGHCLDDEFQYWQCDSWFGYLEMQDKLNQQNWRIDVPFGVVITWFLSGLSILFHIHMVIDRSRRSFGTIRSLQTVISIQAALVSRIGWFCQTRISTQQAYSPKLSKSHNNQPTKKRLYFQHTQVTL